MTEGCATQHSRQAPGAQICDGASLVLGGALRKRAAAEGSTRLTPMMREYTVFNVDQCENLADSIITGKPMRVRNPDTRDELADAFLPIGFRKILHFG